MSSDGKLSELVLRWEELRGRGQPVTPEELCRDTPELLVPLRAEIQLLERLTPLDEAPTGTDTTVDRTALPPGPMRGPALPGYEILGKLGHGGMGLVFRARHLSLDRIVAVKVLRTGFLADEYEIERFRLEARAMAQLDHRHIVPIYDHGDYQGVPYFTIKFMPGGNLADRVRPGGEALPVTVGLMEKIARAVHYAHEAGILHRDLKPANILLDETGEPCVCDFGLAKFINTDSDLTLPGAVLGTIPYMAPEQASGQTDRIGPATDVWALGVILYELIAGRRPFAGPSLEDVKTKVLRDEPSSLTKARPDVPADLEAIVLKCLRKEPEQRYGSAAELADALNAYLHADSHPAPLRPRPRFVVWAAIFAVVALVSALVVASLLWQREPDQTQVVPPQPLTLIASAKPLKDYRWLIGTEGPTLKADVPNEGVLLQSEGLAVVELLAEPPWEHYRLEAEVRHESGAKSAVGIFGAHGAYHSARGVHHCLWALVYADLGQFRGKMELSAARYDDFAPYEHEDASAKLKGFMAAAMKNQPSDWRPLALIVDGQGVHAEWGADRVADVSDTRAGQLVERTMESYQQEVQAGFTPRGGVGIFVQHGSASFKNVVLKPLP